MPGLAARAQEAEGPPSDGEEAPQHEGGEREGDEVGWTVLSGLPGIGCGTPRLRLRPRLRFGFDRDPRRPDFRPDNRFVPAGHREPQVRQAECLPQRCSEVPTLPH
jgi:hypothetical protein